MCVCVSVCMCARVCVYSQISLRKKSTKCYIQIWQDMLIAQEDTVPGLGFLSLWNYRQLQIGLEFIKKNNDFINQCPPIILVKKRKNTKGPHSDHLPLPQ